MSGIDVNLKSNTQLAAAHVQHKPMPSPANATPSVPAPVPVPSISSQELGRDAQALKGESIKQLSDNLEAVH